MKEKDWSGSKIKLRVSEAKYAVARVRDLDLSSSNFTNFPFFALINDGKEITIVAEEDLLEDLDLNINLEKDFRIITFETVLPFDTVGFIAKISGALAAKNIPILVFSSYSTDHILVRSIHLEDALKALRSVFES
ncbi:MAG: ACT domain-containing protein [Archaeoglobus sp.]|nr:ACT domain-containing protein [Archaeoglobus sp.]